MKASINTLVGILVLSSSIFSGCAYMDANVDLQYQPDPGRKSPLSTIPPLVISINVEDQRGRGECCRVGVKKNAFGGITAWAKSNTALRQVVYDALKKELENNAHKVVDMKEDHQDVAINVGLKNYWTDYNSRFVEIEMIGTINADISMLNPADRTVLVSKPMTSTFHEGRQFVTEGAFESVLNGALVEFVRTFSREPGFVGALRAAAKDKVSRIVR